MNKHMIGKVIKGIGWIWRYILWGAIIILVVSAGGASIDREYPPDHSIGSDDIAEITSEYVKPEFLNFQFSERPVFELEFSPESWTVTYAEKVEYKDAGRGITVYTNHSDYDQQMISDPIPVERNSKYFIEFDIQVIQGGVGMSIFNQDSGKLTGANWCSADSRFKREGMVVDSGQSDLIEIIFYNCSMIGDVDSVFSFRNALGWRVENYSPDDLPLSALIEESYPKFADHTLDDWGRVNILREWVYHIVDQADVDMQFEKRTNRTLSSFSAEEFIDFFQQDRGGGMCGLANYTLMRVYQYFGFSAYTMTLGCEECSPTHVVALVEIMDHGKPVLAVEDAFLNYALVDTEAAPLDYFEILRYLRIRDTSRISVLEGAQGTGRTYLCKGACKLMSHWATARGSYSPVCFSMGASDEKCIIYPTLQRLADYWSGPWREVLISNGYPADILYLFLFPYRIQDGSQKNTELLIRAQQVIRGVR